MKQFTIEGYEIREANSDGVTDRLLYYVSNEDLAKTLIKKSFFLSCKPCKQTFTVFDTIEEIEIDTKNALCAKALAKLTDDEKITLGLKKLYWS